MQHVYALVGEEVEQVERLSAERRMGSVDLSLARGTTFIDVFADDEPAVRETIVTVPMARWPVLDLYRVSEPPPRPAA